MSSLLVVLPTHAFACGTYMPCEGPSVPGYITPQYIDPNTTQQHLDRLEREVSRQGQRLDSIQQPESGFLQMLDHVRRGY